MKCNRCKSTSYDPLCDPCAKFVNSPGYSLDTDPLATPRRLEMQRQEIEIDGKVWETCTESEWATISRPYRFYIPTEDGDKHFRIKKAEPRVWEGEVVEFCTGNRVVYVGKDWPGGTPVIVTEKLT